MGCRKGEAFDEPNIGNPVAHTERGKVLTDVPGVLNELVAVSFKILDAKRLTDPRSPVTVTSH